MQKSVLLDVHVEANIVVLGKKGNTGCFYCLFESLSLSLMLPGCLSLVFIFGLRFSCPRLLVILYFFFAQPSSVCVSLQTANGDVLKM